MKKNLNYFLSPVLLLMLLVSFSNTSFALDRKIFAGSMCQAYWGSQDVNFRHPAPYIENTSATGLYSVSCPLIRDNEANTNGLPAVYVRLNRSSTTTLPFSCYLYNVNSTGTSWITDSASYSGTGFTSMYLNLGATTGWGHYTIHCNVPPKSRIYSYRMDEN